jgi:hypothetical protein
MFRSFASLQGERGATLKIRVPQKIPPGVIAIDDEYYCTGKSRRRNPHG